jgi:predicted flap endonuclease-1-like 5' DNA nuclease
MQMRTALVTLLSLALLLVGFAVGWWVGEVGAGASSVALLALPVLAIGFLVGWLVEWVIDNQYRRIRERQPQGTALDAGVSSAHVGELVHTVQSTLSEREEEVDHLRTELDRQESRFEQLRASFDHYASTHPDDLTVIGGVGRVYQWKLRDAGISTFAQLASTTPEYIEQALQIKGWQNVDPASWIEQARTLID